MAITGDITSMIMLYDAGTEVNEEPETGPNHPLNGGSGIGIDESSAMGCIFFYPSYTHHFVNGDNSI